MSGQKNAYFANSPNTSHRPRCALASLRKATQRSAFDGDLRKAKRQERRWKTGVMGQWRKVRYLPEIAKSGYFCGIVRGLGRDGEIQREFVLCSGGKSLSAAFTQNRLFRPECVSAGILMLTYLSTLRSKSRRFLFRPKNAYFANSPNTSHRLRCALASLRKATPRPAFDLGR